jgi:LuxR family maltose regulon positive regulatory protein
MQSYGVQLTSMIDAPASPLVLTKIRVPAARPRQIPRTRLVERLNAERGKGFILVSAPAGYGKTTLLAEWAQSLLGKGTAVAWYALDPSDDDPLPFGVYLVTSLMQALGTLPELARIAQRLRASPQVDLQRILPPIINAVVSNDQACVLVLDDYHLIASPAIHSALAYLLDHLPENLRLALGSRSDPPLPLARLRARGQLLELRTAGLRLSASETASFINETMQLDLSPKMLNTLEARTEGWVTGLQLAALVYQSPRSQAGPANAEGFLTSFSGSHRYLVEYLLEEVVSRQPQEVQLFLLRTSLLERMCAPLCDALLGSARLDAAISSKGTLSETILERLEQANLFLVALDERRTWYRYHHLFRDFLQTRLLKNQPERVTALHRAASEWLAAHDFLREAAQHAFQTQDWEYAAAFVEQHSFTMIIHSEIATIHEWCAAFQEEVMDRHPMLCILQCWPWVFSYRRQNRHRIEARLEQAERLIAELDDDQLAGELREHAAVVRSFLAMAPDLTADPHEQLALGQRMLGDYPEGDPAQFSALITISYAHMALHEAQAATQVLEKARQVALQGRLYFGVVESSFHLARLAQSQGQLRHAEQVCQQTQAELTDLLEHPEQELPGLGALKIALGCVLLEQDRLTEAERELLNGLELIGGHMNPHYLMTAYVALARLREIQGRPEEAAAFLEQLEMAWPDIAFMTRGLRIKQALRFTADDPKTLVEANAWSLELAVPTREALPTPGMGPFGAAEVYFLAFLAWMYVQISLGNGQATRPMLEQQLELAKAHGITNRVIELSLLEAELEAKAGDSAGDNERTWKALERALTAAQKAGYLRIFDQGPALARLLVEAARRSICPDYVRQILTTIKPSKALDVGPEVRLAASALPASSFDIVEPLSERELEVLALVARGASNREIAEQLVITVGTVKSHLNHILRKLDAQNRTEAAARARALGLLDG